MPSSSDEDASDESRSSRWRSADRSRAWDAVSDLGFAAAGFAAASALARFAATGPRTPRPGRDYPKNERIRLSIKQSGGQSGRKS